MNATTTESGVLERVTSLVKQYADDPHHAVFIPLSTLLFLCLVPWGGRFWLQSTTYLFGVKGVSLLIFPEISYRMWVDNAKNIDAVHLQLMRVFGIMMISQVLTYIFTARKSQDSTVWTSLLWSRVIFLASMMLVEGNGLANYDDKKSPRIPYNIMQLAMLNIVLWFAASLYYALTESDWGGYVEDSGSYRNAILRFDFAMFLVNGVLAYALPQRALAMQADLKVGPLHAYMCRFNACAAFASAFISGRASNFADEDDQRGVLLSHGLARLIVFGTMLACQFITTHFNHWHSWTSMAIVMTMAVVDLVGCDVSWLRKEVKSLLQPLIPHRIKED